MEKCMKILNILLQSVLDITAVQKVNFLGCHDFLMLLREVSSAYQSCIHLMKPTAKTVIM